MKKIEFEFEKLSRSEKEGFLAMTDRQKLSYAKKWIRYQTEKAELDQKMKQAQHRAKVKSTTEKEALRKKETHRKIVNGGILEAFLTYNDADFLINLDDSNKNGQLEAFLKYVFSTKYVKEKIQQLSSS